MHQKGTPAPGWRFGWLATLFCPAATLALTVAVTIAPARGAEQHAPLAKALDARGWVELPPKVIDVRYSGPTPAAAPGSPPGPLWYSTAVIDDNSRPRSDERNEQAFVRSIEAAHAGKTHLIEGGTVLLVGPKGRLWSVAEHTPHLLRCYDGKTWT